MAHYQKFFEDADADSSGFLSQEELIGALRKNGYSGEDDKITVYIMPTSIIITTTFKAHQHKAAGKLDIGPYELS